MTLPNNSLPVPKHDHGITAADGNIILDQVPAGVFVKVDSLTIAAKGRNVVDIRVPDLAVHHRSKPNLAMTGVSYLDVL
jgi:hypothetical protein